MRLLGTNTEFVPSDWAAGYFTSIHPLRLAPRVKPVVANRTGNSHMSLFVIPDPEQQLLDSLNAFFESHHIEGDSVASALRRSVDTAKWSAKQNRAIARRYCLELGWTPDDLAAMMVMQCSLTSMTSGEFTSSPGQLTPEGEGFRRIFELCLETLVRTGRISLEIADIERRELEAEIAEL